MMQNLQARGGTDADRAIYSALTHKGLREPADFAFLGEPVSFLLQKQRTALAIKSPSEAEAGLLKLQSAALQATGVRLQIVSRGEAIRSPRAVVETLLRGI